MSKGCPSAPLKVQEQAEAGDGVERAEGAEWVDQADREDSAYAEAHAAAAGTALVPAVVLDSQVVFDWLVFADPAVQPLVAALTAGRLRWLVTPPMLDELAHVLGRGVLARWQPDATALLATCSRWALPCRAPQPQGPALRLKCRDKDDQKFIDLAVAERATWLISRDKAVLALARKARGLGLTILTPAAWAATAEGQKPGA